MRYMLILLLNTCFVISIISCGTKTPDQENSNTNLRNAETRSAKTPHSMADVVALDNTKALLWSSCSEFITCADNWGSIFDLVNGTWSGISKTQLIPLKQRADVVVGSNEKMFIWGGMDMNDPDYLTLNNGAVYDSTTDTWRSTSMLGAASPRTDARSVVMSGKVYIWGGSSGKFGGKALGDGGVYDLNTDTWSTMNTVDAPSARFSHSMVAVGTKIFVWGGKSGPDGSTSTHNLGDGAIYDTETNSWTPLPSVGAPTPRANAMTVAIGNDIIVWGGWRQYPDSMSSINGAIYNVASNSWRTMSAMGDGFTALPLDVIATGVVVNNKLLIWGGSVFDSSIYGGFLFDPAANTWSNKSISGKNFSTFHSQLSYVGNDILFWGGRNHTVGPHGGTWTERQEGSVYRAATDSWSDLPLPK